MDWKSLQEKIAFWAICGILGAAIPTYVEVRYMRRELDREALEIQALKKETRELYANIGDLVTELMRVNPRAYAGDPAAPEPSVDPAMLISPSRLRRLHLESSAAAAAAPAAP